jgi:hypothetical protein
MEKLSEKLEKTLSELAASRLPAQEEPEAQEISEENSPIFEEDEEIVVEGEEIPVEGEEEVEESNLDPPAGIGLKFDEIEEMIDELLSSEK